MTAGRAQNTPLCFSHLCSVKTQVWLNLELLLQSILPSSPAWCELSAAGLFIGVRYPKAEWKFAEPVQTAARYCRCEAAVQQLDYSRVCKLVIFGWFLAAHCPFLKRKISWNATCKICCCLLRQCRTLVCALAHCLVNAEVLSLPLVFEDRGPEIQ